jgi:hypothetical protein
MTDYGGDAQEMQPTQPLPPQVSDGGSPGPPQPHSAPKRPWWRRTWVLPTGVGIVALGIGIGVGVGSASSSNTTKAAARPAPVTVSVPLAPSTVVQTVTAPAPTPTKAATSAAPAPPAAGATFKDGTFVVGTDIKAGHYRTNGPPPENKIGAGTVPCVWARLSALSTDRVIDGGAAFGPTTIEVQASDKALETHNGCTWTQIG